MKKRLAFLLPILLLLPLAAIFLVGLGRDPSAIPSVLIDRPTPEIDLPALLPDKPGLKSTDLKRDFTLVNVFASWCAPCRVEHPLLMELAAEESIEIFGINYKDRPEDATRWLQSLGDPYDKIGVDREGRSSIDWGVYGLPETFLVDATGKIRFKQVGPLTQEVLQQQILPIVQQLRREQDS